jgi:hypothetical protein
MKLFASEYKGKLKNKKELKVDVVKWILNKWKVELARVQCIPVGITKGCIKAFFVENLIFCCSTFNNNIKQHLK